MNMSNEYIQHGQKPMECVLSIYCYTLCIRQVPTGDAHTRAGCIPIENKLSALHREQVAGGLERFTPSA
jgi:hypothetical protein